MLAAAACAQAEANNKPGTVVYAAADPKARLRPAVTAYAGLPIGDEAVAADEARTIAEDSDLPDPGSKAPCCVTSRWAMRIAEIYEVLPLVCPQCGGELTLVAFLTRADTIQLILLYFGEPATPPRIALA